MSAVTGATRVSGVTGVTGVAGVTERDAGALAEESPFRGYYVRLDSFEGPLDLLLHLIKRDKIEICQISIARITEQYLDYLNAMRVLRIDVAGEFVVMAATLMRIKAQQLLPRPPEVEDDGMPQTEEELIARLIEYKKFKEAARSLRALEDTRRQHFERGFVPRLPDDYQYPLREVSIFALVDQLRELLQRAPEEKPHEVESWDVRLEDQITFVLGRLADASGHIRFRDLFAPGTRRVVMAVTFLAILELARQQMIRIVQEELFGEIWLYGASLQ